MSLSLPKDLYSVTPLPFSSDDYKEWICLQNVHIQWLKSDLATVTPLENFLRKCSIG